MNFAVDLPLVSERKLATIKVVAKHSVLNAELIEKRRAEFDFLDQNHDLHQLYTVFVNQYREVASGASRDGSNLLERAIEAAKSIEADALNKPEPSKPRTGSDCKPVNKHISNWHDFVVLETVEFFTSDINGTSHLSAPLSLEDMQLERLVNETEPVFKSPITGELVPASQFHEHVQIHLSSKPTKTTTTNLDTENAAANLEALRRKRRKLEEES